jgi:hypothetical protein
MTPPMPSERLRGLDALVAAELAKMWQHLLAPLGAGRPPATQLRRPWCWWCARWAFRLVDEGLVCAGEYRSHIHQAQPAAAAQPMQVLAAGRAASRPAEISWPQLSQVP